MEALAKDLRTQTSPRIILPLLKSLTRALEDDNKALAFVRAGGLPVVIAILRGTAMSYASATSHVITNPHDPLCLATGQAGAALKQLLCCKAVMGELSSPRDVILPLADVMCNAPTDLGRLRAAEALVLLAQGQQANRRAMAEGGVMEPLVVLYMELLGFDRAITPSVCELMKAVLQLAHLLISTERAAAHDLRRAILAPEANHCLSALSILKKSLGNAGGHLAPVLKEVRIADTLVIILKQDAPHSVALAAAALHCIAGTPAGAQALVEASGAIPALVRLLEKASPPGDPARDTGLIRRIAKVEVRWEERSEHVHFGNPTAYAAMALEGLCDQCVDTRPAINSFVESGGVRAIVGLLKKTSCPVTLHLTAVIIQRLLTWTATGLAAVAKRSRGAQNLMLAGVTSFADRFFEAGLCQAGLHVLKTRGEGMHRQGLCVLGQFIECVSAQSGSQRTLSATMALLVSGGFVEFAVAHIAQAGPDMLECGMSLFRNFSFDSRSVERMCKPKTVDSLMSWFAKWLSEVNGTVAIQLCDVLFWLQDKSPCFIAAAIRANVLPGLVRTLRKCHTRPSLAAALPSPITISEAVKRPLSCLEQLLQYCKEHAEALWKPTIDVGQVLIKLFPLVEIPATTMLVMVSGMVMLLTPKGKAGQSGAQLLREIARLVTGSAPVAIRAPAAKVLLDSLMMHPELSADCHTWGIEDSVRQLTLHSNPGIANDARQLEHLLFRVAQDDHKQDGKTAAPASTRPSRPGPKSGGTPDSSAMGSGSRHTLRAASDTTVPVETRASKQPGKKASSTGAGRGRQGEGTVQACACCRITADKLESGGKLKSCSACRSVHYCGTACQKAHWQEHKATCNGLQTSRP